MISAIAKAGMDKLNFHFYESIFSKLSHRFWNSEYSWQNKWRDGNPDLGEDYPFSSTLFVFLTDGWHLLQFIFLNTFFLALFFIALHDYTIREAIVHLILLRALFGLVFELHFKYIFASKL
jgi:hypothetical protein